MIDLDLVLKMKIPLQRIKVERYSIMGQSVRAVGYVNQTVQCVQQGRISGNIHIQAKVIRDLYSLYDVDCIASKKTFTRLVGKSPIKPPDNTMDLEDDYEEPAEEEDDHIDLADDGNDNSVQDDDEEKERKFKDSRKARSKDSKATEEDDDADNDNDKGRFGEVNTADIPWNWGCQPVPTVDELYPDEDPADNARWYQELHQPRPTTPPRKAIGKIKRKSKSNLSTEDDEKFCKLCYHEGEPVSVVMSHYNLDITCPTMTDEEKETMFGPNWIARMYGYPD